MADSLHAMYNPTPANDDESMSYFANELLDTTESQLNYDHDQNVLSLDATSYDEQTLEGGVGGFGENSNSDSDYFTNPQDSSLRLASESSSSSSSFCEEEIPIRSPEESGTGVGAASSAAPRQQEKVITPSNKNSDKVLAGKCERLLMGLTMFSLQEEILYHLLDRCSLCYRR